MAVKDKSNIKIIAVITHNERAVYMLMDSSLMFSWKNNIFDAECFMIETACDEIDEIKKKIVEIISQDDDSRYFIIVRWQPYEVNPAVQSFNTITWSEEVIRMYKTKKLIDFHLIDDSVVLRYFEDNITLLAGMRKYRNKHFLNWRNAYVFGVYCYEKFIKWRVI